MLHVVKEDEENGKMDLKDDVFEKFDGGESNSTMNKCRHGF